MTALFDLRPFVRYVRQLKVGKGEFPEYIIPYDCRMFYGLSGAGRLVFESGVHTITRGSLFLWPSGMKYHMEPADAETKLFLLAVNFDLNGEHMASAFPIPPVRARFFSANNLYVAPECAELPMNMPIALKDAYFAEPILQSMLSEYEDQKLLSCEYLSASMSQLLTLIARQREQSQSDQRISQILGYIHTHYAEPISNESLGALFGFHPNSLNRLMVRHTGSSLHQYVLMVRLRQAIWLIESTDLPIAEIADKVGISDPGYFSKLFRSKTGRSPREYRKG